MLRRALLLSASAGVLGIGLFQISRLGMLNKLRGGPKTERMPALFIGHGSPMNAIDDNPYTKTLVRLGSSLPRPRAVLVISAHWMTQGTFVTEMARPKTIHDFFGFPQALFDVQYPAPGSPEVAKLVRETVADSKVLADTEKWGLDHGTWSVLRHMYPEADIPVLQLSLDMEKPFEYHVQVGKELSKLRDQGVMILGSGNLVHNLRTIRWEPNAPAYDWAIEYDEWLKKKLVDRDHKAVLSDFHASQAAKLSVPTFEHYLPLHYVLGASTEKDQLKFEYEEMQNGSISMRSFSLS